MTRRMLAIATLLMCGVCLPAMAQEAYVGASFLRSSGEFTTYLETFSADADGWKIFGGYNFNKYIGIEATYYDLGHLEDSEGISEFTADASAFDLAFRGILPLGNRFELFGKLGPSNVTVDSTLNQPGANATSDERHWKLYYSAGLALKLGQRFGLRADWEAWAVEGTLQEYSLGAYFRFGKK
jgi:OOP family OmpA-OmpF porin